MPEKYSTLEGRFAPGQLAACLGLVLLWAAGSAMDIEKYLPGEVTPLLIAGAVIVSLLLFLVRTTATSGSQPSKYTFVILWLLVVVAYGFIHPIAAQHTITQGNDSENALYLGSRNLLHGRYPYYVRTYLNNPITPMPGALILDAPFAALGQAGLQNVLWYGLLSVFAYLFFSLRSTALLFLLLVLGNAHSFVNLFTGADYPVNCFYICIAVFWFLRKTAQPGTLAYYGSSLFLGVALSSRLSYLLIVPLVLLGYLYQEQGAKRAVWRLAQPVLVTLAVTAPYLLYDPKHFSPLHVANFLSAMTPGHQKLIFDLLVGSSILITLSSFVVPMSLSRVYLIAALAAAVILVPPGLIAAAHQSFTVNGVLALGYTDTAYIFLCLWTCHALEQGAFARYVHFSRAAAVAS